MSREVLLGMGEQDLSGPTKAVGLTCDVRIGRNSSTLCCLPFLCLQMGSCVPVTTEGSSQRQKSRPSSTAWSSFLVSNVPPCVAALSGHSESKLVPGAWWWRAHRRRDLVQLEGDVWDLSVSLCVAPSKDDICFLTSLFISVAVHQGPGVQNLEKI